MEWHVVTSQGSRILGVFGSAILSMAQECARRVERDTGFPAWVHQVKGERPSVGQCPFCAGVRTALHALDCSKRPKPEGVVP